ncbi:MAG: hypothetical protein AAF580_05255 [Pseudomonadota bacterium]
MERIANRNDVISQLGGSPQNWEIKPLGTASLSPTFCVTGPQGSVLVKWATDRVTLGRHAIALPPKRVAFEADGARLLNDASSAFTIPLAADPSSGVILAGSLLSGKSVQRSLAARENMPGVLAQVAAAIARGSFLTSDLAVDLDEQRSRIAHFSGNAALTQLNTELIFDGPFMDHPTNNWNSPHLDEDVQDLLSDRTLVFALQHLKLDYLTRADCLLHNNISLDQVYLNDADCEQGVSISSSEFVGYGPIEFDYSCFLASFYLNLFAQDGLGPGALRYQSWMLNEVEIAANRLLAEFSNLWRTRRTGTAYSEVALARFEDGEEIALAEYTTKRAEAMAGFIGGEIIRRIVGMAGSPEMLQIEDEAVRAQCERRALRFARRVLLDRACLTGTQDMIPIAEDILRSGR